MPAQATPSSPASLRSPRFTRRSWLLLMLVWGLLVGASLVFDIGQIRQRNTELMREGARNIFRTIEATRAWNAHSAGVYAPVSPELPPNPYLKQAGRDLITREGTQLTLVNPAYMTRLIGDIIAADSDLRIRMPSLKPINPNNAPDDWEAGALLALERGENEISGILPRADGSLEFRYMAPLRIVDSCLHCHTQQTYRIGDLRGGISIGQPYAPAEASSQQGIQHSIIRHLLVFAVFAALSYALLMQLHRHWKKAEEALDNLVQAEKMASLGRLVSGFAHELNTPIGVAVNAVSHGEHSLNEFARLLDRDEVSEQELRQHLDEMHQSSQLALSNLRRAASLVQGFKRSSIDMGQEETRSFELAELIRDALHALHNVYRHCAEVEVICPPELRITGIPGLLDQIFTNLVTNSVVHGFDEGRRRGHIRIEVAPLGNNQLLISYADDGAGMPPDILSKVFEPFFTTRRDSGGSGLGLYICYNLVTTRLGGSIRCDSLPDGGTHFLITLPVSLNTPPTTARES